VGTPSRADADGLQAVIVEDHLALRKGIELLLRAEGIRTTGVAERAADARQMILTRRPDVAIVDLALEGSGSGLDVARRVVAAWPEARILIYTGGSVDQDTLRGALTCGARGVALKAGHPAELTSAIRAVAEGGEYVDPRLAQLLDAREAPAVHRLSPRERQVLDLLAAGLSGDEVAERLVVSPQTVQTHVRNLVRRLGARNRVHALAIALRHREIDLAG
jgi:DNA-binding NarL/FixJ family response regulator